MGFGRFSSWRLSIPCHLGQDRRRIENSLRRQTHGWTALFKNTGQILTWRNLEDDKEIVRIVYQCGFRAAQDSPGKTDENLARRVDSVETIELY